jgi:CTD small phosphatase-like protein 2
VHLAPNTPGKASTSSNDNDKMEEGFDHNIETSNESVITENMTCVVQSHDEVPLFSPSLRKSSDNEDEEQELTSNELDESTETNSSSNTHADDSFNPYLFIATLPPHTQVVEHGKICLPKKTCPYPFTLALDLDETLVHCTVEPIPNPDIVFPVTFNGNHYQVYVRKRPYLDHFLESISGKFEVSFIIIFN